MASFNVLSCNVRGVASTARRDVVVPVLSQYNVVFVQESYICNQRKAECFGREWKGKCYWSFGGVRAAGVGILLSDRVDFKVLDVRRDTDGRVLCLLVKWGIVRYSLLCVYAPVNVSDRKQFFRDLYQYVYPNSLVVLGGDFNCVLYDRDTSAVSGANRAGSEELKEFLSDRSLIDAGMTLNGNGLAFTWFGQGVGSRLDRFYVSKEMLNVVPSCVAMPLGLSDHDGVILSVHRSANGKSRGLWKMNNELLKDSEFVNAMNDWMKKSIERWNGQRVREYWIKFKNGVKKFVIRYSVGRARERKRERDALTKEIIFLKRRLAGGEDVGGRISELNGRLKALVESESEGVKVRSKAKWIEEGERPTRFFFNMCGGHGQGNFIDSLNDENGTEWKDENGKRAVIEWFYRDLFKVENVEMDVQDVLLSRMSAVLSEEAVARCEGSVRVEELELAMKGMANGKTPGEDGLSLEFYKCFSERLLPVLCKLANECFREDRFPEECVRSVVRLAFKKGDRKELKNWRPISLLNLDYKIVSKALSGRLREVMPEIVSEDQTCGVMGRVISDNLNLLRDVLDHLDVTGEGGVLLSLDQEKAFDRVDRAFLDRVLERFGFGVEFRRWIRMLYVGASARVMCNGSLTESIVLGKGIRQGCSLSPMLYVLFAEVLACNVRAEKGICGFLVPGSGGQHTNISQYADDTSAVLCDVLSVEKYLDVVELFGRGTGARLNRGKSEAMWIGAWKRKKDKPFGLKWVTKMKVLGVWFGDEVEDENWVTKCEKLRRTLDMWSGRHLSLRGKVLIVKVLGLSKLDHVARVLIVPKNVIAKVNSLVWKFVWSGKIELVKRETCLLPRAMGGLGMVDFGVRVRALRIANVIGALNRKGSKMWCYLRYFVGVRFSVLRHDWSLLRDNSKPCAAVMSKYYKCVYDEVRLCPDDCNVELKKMYGHLIHHVLVQPKCERYWTGVLGRVDWKRVWKDLDCSLSENIVSEVRWRIVHRVTKVRDSLCRWGYNVGSDRCAVCGKCETLEHCFLECSRVRKAWGWVVRIVRKWSRDFVVDVKCVFLGLFEGVRKDLVMFVVESMLNVIWYFRNSATFRNSVRSYLDIVRKCKSEIVFRLRVESTRLSAMHHAQFWDTTRGFFR